MTEDLGLAERLQAAHAVGDRAIRRCLEIDRHRKALLMRYASHCQVNFAHDELESMDGWLVIEKDVSTLGEKSLRLELVKA